MSKARGRITKREAPPVRASGVSYDELMARLAGMLETARRASARAVNALMTATYWEIGRRIVEFEQGGADRATYGDELLERLGEDLSACFGRGFSRRNLVDMRRFYAGWPIRQTLSAESGEAIGSTAPRESVGRETPRRISTQRDGSGAPETGRTVSRRTKPPIGQTASAESEAVERSLRELAERFPLPWSHYVRLLPLESAEARRFYETEALRGGWSVRQLDRQVSSLFYERTALSRKKAAMLEKGSRARAHDAVGAEEEIRDPLVLEFLGLKDEYSETDLEESLLRHLETFLLELGGDFTFVGRQRRLRIGREWYRVDLLFFHRKLRCLVIIDLKIGKFMHADAGQMHAYLNYACEHWTIDGENPPVGLILCSERDDALAKYALEGLPNKVVAREYRLALPEEKTLAAEIEHARERLEGRRR